jgi:ParB family chromosome partitioning protein
MLRDGLIDMGHARSLLTLSKDDQYQLAQEVQKKVLSVRQLEELIRLKHIPVSNEGSVPMPDALKNYQRILSKRLGTKVSINQGASGAGKIVIRFASESKRDELLQAMQHLSD